MSATASLFEAELGIATELSKVHELVHSTGNCGSLEPRWWVVDIGVRARVVNTTANAIPQPTPAEYRAPHFGSHAPLHLRIDAGLLDGRMGSNRSWLIDATSTRAYLFASLVSVHLLGPESLTPYVSLGEPSRMVPRDAFVQVLAGLWPCDTRHQHGIPGVPARSNNCSIRVRVPAGTDDLAVPIPAGARTLAIVDTSGSNAPWTWQLGEAPADRVGRIVLHQGQSRTTPVPHFTHVAPATALAVERDVLLVFGVDL